MVLVALAPIVPGGVLPAVASGGVEFAFVSVSSEDGFGSGCPPPASDFYCLGAHDPGSPESLGDDEVSLDTGQLRSRIVIRTREIPVAGPLVASLLPDESIVIAFDDARVESPLFPAYTDVRDETGPWPTDPVAEVRLSDDRMEWWVLFYNPATPERGVHRRYDYDPWSEYEEGAWDYRHVYVPNELAHASTDAAVLLPLWIACDSLIRNATAGWCATLAVESVRETYREATPNVRTGVDLDRAEVATKPATPTEASARGTPAAAAGSWGPGAGALASLALAREAPAPARLESDVTRLTPEDAPGPASPARTPSSPASRSASAWEEAPPSLLPTLVGAGAAAFALGWLALALYQRLTRSKLLEQDTRRALHEILAKTPGVSISAAARALGVDLTTAIYHARVLARAGLVVSRSSSVRRETHLFPAGSTPAAAAARDLEVVLSHPLARAIAQAVARDGPVTREKLRGLPPAPRSTLSWHVRRLVAARVLEETPPGRVLSIAPGAREIVAALPGEGPAAGASTTRAVDATRA